VGPVGRVHLHPGPDALFDEFNQRGVSFVKTLSF
jgi:hypothetical protein